jgi:hypothetical protein
MSAKLYFYSMLDKKVHSVEMVAERLKESMSSYLSCMDDEEFSTAEDYKSLMLDLLVECRRIYTQIDSIADELKEYNNDLLNSSKKPSEHIKPFSDNEFKKSFIDFL